MEDIRQWVAQNKLRAIGTALPSPIHIGPRCTEGYILLRREQLYEPQDKIAIALIIIC